MEDAQEQDKGGRHQPQELDGNMENKGSKERRNPESKQTKEDRLQGNTQENERPASQTILEEHKSGEDIDKRTVNEEDDDEDGTMGEHMEGRHIDEAHDTGEARLTETRAIRQEKQDRVDRAVKEERESERKGEEAVAIQQCEKGHALKRQSNTMKKPTHATSVQE